MPILAPFAPLLRALVVLMTLCVSLQAPTAVNAQSPTRFAPVYTFNNGTVDSSKTCLSAEWSSIQTVVGNAIGATNSIPGRELLRSPNSNRRNLRFKCSDCGGRPLCLATIGIGCALQGKRRRLAQQQNERSLTTSPCSGQIAAVESALNAIKTNVSASCQALLNAPRHAQCAEYTFDCNIYGFTVVRPDTAQTVATKLNTTGTSSSFCSSVGPVTIRADTNFFLGSVNITFGGTRADGTVLKPETRMDSNQPYVSFGKSYAIRRSFTTISVPKLILTGRTLLPGVYTVSAFSLDNPTAGRNATFIVKNC